MSKEIKDIVLESAEVMALRGLEFLAQDPDRLGRFIALTGFGPADLRSRAQDPDFLAAVLGYLLDDESALLVFCSHYHFKPEHVAPAHFRLTEAAVDSSADASTDDAT